MRFPMYTRALVLALSMCSTPALASENILMTERPPASSDVVATIDSPYGSIVFIEEAYDSESRIGILTTGSISLSSLRKQEATPLEIFLLFRDKGQNVPERLIQDHYASVQREPVNFADTLEAPDASAKQEFHYYLYRNLSPDADLCKDLVVDFANGYGPRPAFVWNPKIILPPSEHSLVGLNNGVYDYMASWNTYSKDIAYIDPPLAFQRTLDAVNLHSQTGNVAVWSEFGYKRDVAVCLNSWRIELDYYAEQSDLYYSKLPTEIPWDYYQLTPCDNGQCSFGQEIFGFCYSNETSPADEDEPLHNDLDFRVRIFGQKMGGNTWQGPSVHLRWFGEGARYYSAYFREPRRYKIEVTDVAGNAQSKLCKATYLVYMLSNGNWNANGYTGH